MLREVCREQVIMAEGLKAIDFGKILALNESATWLWKEAHQMGDFTVESLADRLCEEYDVTRENALADVAELVGNLRELNMIDD